MESIDIIYHDTSQILYTIKEELAVPVTGTQKVQMIQHSIGTDEVKLYFLHIKVPYIPLLKSYTAFSVSEDSNTMDSEAAVALVSLVS